MVCHFYSKFREAKKYSRQARVTRQDRGGNRDSNTNGFKVCLGGIYWEYMDTYLTV